MTILVYGEKAGRTHENQMLQAFLEAVEDRWATSDDWIFIVANTLWNGAEIDLVCILPNAIFVADFKNHDGKLTGTENGPWEANGVQVKGGRKTNPYQQLRDNKFSVLNWLQSQTILPGRNLGHISAGVVFSGSIDNQLRLPPKVRSWFHPTDLGNCTTLLDGLASPELHIDRKDAQEIVQQLGVQTIQWTSSRPRVRNLDHQPLQAPAPPSLTEHQRESLQALCNFIESDELVTFSVLGMTSTGKTRLLSKMAVKVAKLGRKAIVLKPNRRLADRAKIESDSIYAHLFGREVEDRETAAEETAEPDVIPMCRCTDDPDCIYLLDDAHLLGNSKFITPDGKQYGSGHLLDDFHAFTELGKGKRKAIFFGDPYQIQRSGDDESALLGGFQKGRGLKHQSLELLQVIDTTGRSAKLDNAERLVKAIRAKKFAELDLLKDESFRQAQNWQEAKTQILERFRSDLASIWYLVESHAQANQFTQWVRERLHGKEQLASLEAGDLLEVYVSPQPPRDDLDTTFGSPPRIPSGTRRVTAAVENRTQYGQRLRGRPHEVRFHSVGCTLVGPEQSHLNVLEEFLIAERPKLGEDTAIAERVWRNRLLKNNQTLPAFTYARYGYASTVHHAQGMSQPICYVDCNHESGRHSEGFYRWLYSALTVAEREVVLVGFTDIHPFDSAKWNAKSATKAEDIPIGGGWSFQPDGVASEKHQQRALPTGLDQSKDVPKSVAVCLKIMQVTTQLGWTVVKATCHPYQEQYDLAGPQSGQCQIRIVYNGENVVTAIHVLDSVLDSAHWQLLADIAAKCLAMNNYSSEAMSLLQSARARMEPGGWKVVSAMETAYRLTLTVARKPSERAILEVNFDKQGLVSTLRPLKCSDTSLLDEIKELLL